tara:strand:- start:256 stop:2049 length:1794 start_codon:yes stop_codon:yes gene_type:complete
MPLPFVPNSISMLLIRLEHGGAAPDSLSEYYGKSGAASSGTISMNDFRQTGGSPPAATSSGLQCELDARNSSSWPGSGSTWSDTTSNGRDWSLNNGPTNGSASVVFDGTNDYAQISDAAWLPENNGPWTIEFMVKIHDFAHGTYNTSSRYLYSKTSPSNQACSVGFRTTSSTQLYMVATTQGGGNVDEDVHRYDMGNPSNWVNTWMHVMFTHTGNNGTLTYYINNSQVASFTGRTFKDNSAVARLMTFDPSNGNWGAWVDGEIRVARFYNKVLSSSERTANYNNAQSSSVPVAASVLSFSPSAHSGSQFTGTFDFDVNVADFTAADISVSGGTKGALTTVSAKQYTMPITPSGNSSLTVSVSNTSATFNAGNQGNNALSHAVAYSTFPNSGLLMHLDAGASGGVSGTTWYDDSGNGNHATLYNGASYNSTKGGCVDFDGSNDYAQTGTTNLNSGVSGEITLSGFFQFDSQPWGEMAFMRPTSDYFQLGCNGSNKIRNLIRGPAWTGSHDRNITWGTGWRHMVVTYDSSLSSNRYKFYIDGSVFYQANPSGNISTNTNPVKIGHWHAYFDGRIMALGVWNRALTSTEITSLYNEYNNR